MTGYQKRFQILAISLTALAGYVDALGFLKLGGFFVAFMSGNSTRMSVGLVEHAPHAALGGALIAGFVAGVVLGSTVGHFAGAHRRPAILAAVALLLAGGAMLDGLALDYLAVGAVVLAMGAENAVLQQEGGVNVGLTYMTGTLVKCGQRLSAAFMGGPRFAWVPPLLLWLGLVVGAAAGAATYPHYGLGGLWFAALAAAVLCGVTVFLPATEPG